MIYTKNANNTCLKALEEIPSETLRQLISIYEGINLDEYSWDDELKKEIFDIHTDEFIEEHVETLKEAYQYGFNIGHCGTTARYLSIHFEDALMNVGMVDLLKGTKNSRLGGHCWIEMNGFVIDPTLMIKFPVEEKEKLLYTTNKVLSKSASKILSEYDIYDLEYQNIINDNAYYEKVLQRNKNVS